MTSQRHFSFSFPEEMDGLIDFLFVPSCFSGLQPSKNIKKSDIEILYYTPILDFQTGLRIFCIFRPLQNNNNVRAITIWLALYPVLLLYE